MKRRGREEEEACGVWLDAAALKRRKVQTHLITSNTKLLTLFPGERTKIPFSQRRIPPVGVRQTSIASFFTLQPGKTNSGDKRNVSSLRENQTNQESKEDVIQLDHPVQVTENDCITPPLATSTPIDIQEVELSHCFQDGCHRTETRVLTVPPALQPDTLVCDGDSKASLACPVIRDLETSSLLNQGEKEDSSWKRKWLHGSKKNNYQGVERDVRPLGGKSQHPLDRIKSGRLSAKENRQAPILQTYKDSWSGENTESVKQSPGPDPVFSWDIGKNEDSWSQLFTADSQGQQVIAHNCRSPFREVTNKRNQDLERFSNNSQAKCQDRAMQLSLQSDLLFTQDSEGNKLKLSQDCCRRFLIERQKHL
ncbi:aurora kinase A and ninein-interacting protein [Sorex araneus]|uniref:aurora kinase A and ninein-interacting protein n=1 Tax=Sorex araneus TaxID=42254 RepID=UPI002433C1A8|nr:aurora kinase A and ninein-interacting protein [Sorex araneus]